MSVHYKKCIKWIICLVKVVTAEGSKITTFDLTATNGMVHVIDTVMIPPGGNIVDLVVGNSDLKTLLSKVQSAGLAGALQGLSFYYSRFYYIFIYFDNISFILY